MTIIEQEAVAIDGATDLESRLDRAERLYHSTVEERDEARAEAINLRSQRDAWCNRATGLTQERDELRAKIDAIVQRAHQEADAREWCPEFDNVMEELGLPRRKHDYTIEVDVTMRITITVEDAETEDDANERVTTELLESEVYGLPSYAVSIDDWTIASTEVAS